jgi:hypothetical protein
VAGWWDGLFRENQLASLCDVKPILLITVDDDDVALTVEQFGTADPQRARADP